MRRREFLKSGVAAVALSSAVGIGSIPTTAYAAEEVSIIHYFTAALSAESFNEILAKGEKELDIKLKRSPIGHEDFKTAILVMASARKLPDTFSYWAGARTKFVADQGVLADVDDAWDAAGLSDIVPPALAAGATMYDGHRKLFPLGYHFTAVYYNKAVFDKAGVTKEPETWDEFLDACDKIKASGVTPIALGSKDRWPAQFWFDYIMLRSAGPDYRAGLMAGTESYTDPRAAKTLEMWKTLLDRGYFNEYPNAEGWTDSADRVARGEAGMVLLATWLAGYLKDRDMVPGDDFSFFEFPTINPETGSAVVAGVDGMVVSNTGGNAEGAKKLGAWLVSDIDVQTQWVKTKGSLSPNSKIDKSIYNAVQKKAVEAVESTDHFTFNYDLTTTPPMAEVGLNMFTEFLDDPTDYMGMLERTEAQAKEIFGK